MAKRQLNADFLYLTKRIRAWFDSNVKKGLDSELMTVSERMMGHKTDITAKYQQILKDPEECAHFYKDQIEPTLLILGRSEYVKKINDDIEAMHSTIEQLAIENKELKGQINKIKDKFDMNLKQTEKSNIDLLHIIHTLQKRVEQIQSNKND